MNRWLYYIQLILIVPAFILNVNYATKAQGSSFEFWPEMDIWYRLSPSTRLSAYIPITKYHESQNRDLNIYLQADYAFGKTKHPFNSRLIDENRAAELRAWLVRIAFMEGWSLGDNADSYNEDMAYAEIHRRVPLKGNFLLTHRFRTDFRWLGDENKFSYRFRYRLMLEKEFKTDKSSIVPYVSAEPFWDSRYSTFSRIRAIIGTTTNWGPRFAYETNITYQYDEHYTTNNLLLSMLFCMCFLKLQNRKLLLNKPVDCI